MTAEALASLYSLIRQDTRMPDKPSRYCLQRLAYAAEKAFAERALLLDENRLLFQQTNERECRQSTRSKAVGKAKVISYKDIIEA